MTIDLILEKLIAKLDKGDDANSRTSGVAGADTERSPAFANPASAAAEAVQAAVEEIERLAAKHAEEIEAEKQADAQAAQNDGAEDDKEEEEEEEESEGGDQALDESAVDVVDETIELAMADTAALDAPAGDDAGDGAGDDAGATSGGAQASAAGGGSLSVPGWLAPAVAVVGGGIGGGIAATSGSSSDDGAPQPPVGPSSVVSGLLMMGPVTRGLSVTAYDADGNELGSAEVDENGEYSIDVGEYTGPLLVRVSDNNAEEGNYIDEALGDEVDLTVDLRAMTSVGSGGGDVVLNITPLTELAVRELGLTSTSDNALSAVSATIEQVRTVNQAIATLFLGEGSPSIEVAEILPTIDRDGNDIADTANTYGVLLAALSGADSSETIAGGVGMEATIAALSEAVTEVLAENISWAVQDNAGVAARAIIEAGLQQTNDNANVVIEDDSFLDDAGIRTDVDGPVVTETTVSVDENATAVGTLAATDATGVASWALASGAGDDDNDLFELSADGALTIREAQDFEATEAPFSIRVIVTDTLGNATEQVVTVNVADVNEAPTSTTLENQSTVNFQDVSIDTSGAFSDVDANDVLTFSAEGLPEGYVIDSATGVITGQTAVGGDAAVTVTATDSGGLTTSQSFTIAVTAAPVILAVEAPDPMIVKQGDLVEFSLRLSEAVNVETPDDGPTLTLNVNGQEVTASYDGQDPQDSSVLRFVFTAPSGDGDALEVVSINLGEPGDPNAVTIVGDATGEGLLTDIVGQTTDALIIDNTAPTLEIAIDKDPVIAGETASVTFTFSEQPDSFADGDITVNGGVLTGLQVDPENPAVYTATFTPDAGQEDTATIEVSAFSDRAGNPAASGALLDFAFDTLAPTVTDIDLDLLNQEVRITFSEEVANFTESDIIVSGGELSNLQLVSVDENGAQYRADFAETPGFDGLFSAGIAGGSYTDVAGNAGSGEETPEFSIRAPSSTGFINASQFPFITFSGNGTAGLTVGFRIDEVGGDGSTSGSRTEVIDSFGAWSQTIAGSTLDQGTFVITGSLTDADGNTVAAVTRQFIIDTQVSAPVIGTTPSLIEDSSFDSEGNLTLTGTLADDDITSVLIEWDDGQGGVDTAKEATIEGGVWTVEFNRDELAAMQDGNVTFAATATDRAGNTATASSATITLELENAAPIENSALPTIEQNVLTGSAGGAEILNLTNINGEPAFTDADPNGSSNGELTYSGVDLPDWLEVTPAGVVQVRAGQTAPSMDGSLTITVRATDGGDPPLSQTRTIELDLISAPTVTAIAPVGGAASVQQGALLAFNVTMSETVTVNTTGGSPTLTLSVGGTQFTATYDEGSSSGDTLRFTATAPLANGSGVSIEAINLGGATVIGDLSSQPWATDVVGQTAASITVDNEGPDVLTAGLDVDENQTAVGVLRATDNFDFDIEWAFAAGTGDTDNGLFNLAADGTLTLIAPKDFESDAESYSIRVQATDDAGNTTEEVVTVALSDVNERPESSGLPIDPLSVVVDSAAGTVLLDLTDLNDDGTTTTNDVAFTDPDSGSPFGDLTYSGSDLPPWLEVTSAGVVQVKAGETAPSSAEDAFNIFVRATDGEGLFVERSVEVSVVSAPTLTALANDVGNLDVRSDLVMTASENVALTTADGTYDITIRNNGGPGYRTENNDNTQTIRIVVSGGAVSSVQTLNGADPENPDYTEDHGVNISDLLTINGDQVRINPHFDLDLGNDYHIDVDGGLFVGADSGQGNVAFDGSTEGDFSTVNPEAATTVAAAEQAQWFDASGALVNSAQWVSVDATGVASDLNPTQIGSIGSGAYVIVFKDWDLDGGGTEREGDDNLADDGLIADGVRSNGFNVHVLDFGTDDLIYIDDQHNNDVVNAPNAGEVADVGGQDGLPAGTTRVTRDGVTGRGQGLLNLSPDAGLNFSSALLVDLDSGDVAAGENWSDLLNGRGESPIIGG